MLPKIGEGLLCISPQLTKELSLNYLLFLKFSITFSINQGAPQVVLVLGRCKAKFQSNPLIVG